MLMWAATWQNQQCGCSTSEDSDQPGHPPSLIRVFAVRMKKPWVLTHLAHREDSDQTGRMPRLIWNFSGRTVTLMVLSCTGSIVMQCSVFVPELLKIKSRNLWIHRSVLWLVFVCVFPTLRLLQTFHTRGVLKLMIQQWSPSPTRNNVSIPLCMLYPLQEAESKYV